MLHAASPPAFSRHHVIFRPIQVLPAQSSFCPSLVTAREAAKKNLQTTQDSRHADIDAELLTLNTEANPRHALSRAYYGFTPLTCLPSLFSSLFKAILTAPTVGAMAALTRPSSTPAIMAVLTTALTFCSVVRRYSAIFLALAFLAAMAADEGLPAAVEGRMDE